MNFKLYYIILSCNLLIKECLKIEENKTTMASIHQVSRKLPKLQST